MCIPSASGKIITTSSPPFNVGGGGNSKYEHSSVKSTSIISPEPAISVLKDGTTGPGPPILKSLSCVQLAVNIPISMFNFSMIYV